MLDHMKTEIMQLFIGNFTLLTIIKDRFEQLSTECENSVTISLDYKSRSNTENELIGLSQMYRINSGYLIELTIKAVYYQEFNTKCKFEHDLIKLFKKLPDKIQRNISEEWWDISYFSNPDPALSIFEFLTKYKDLFTGSRYLYEDISKRLLNYIHINFMRAALAISIQIRDSDFRIDMANINYGYGKNN